MAVRFFSKSTIVQGFPRGKNFTNSISFDINFLVIGGGSGGFQGSSGTGNNGGGGNAGGYRTSTGGNGYRDAPPETPLTGLTNASYTVTVAAAAAHSTAGNNSVFSTITSLGGTQTGVYNDGYHGGQGSGTANIGRNGGYGTENTITGSSLERAGGGGGSHLSSGRGEAGGGNGNRLGQGHAASANSGSGGGGGGSLGAGGAGGSGLVVIQYPSARTITIGAGLTGATSTVGANKVTTFTAGTGTVSFA